MKKLKALAFVASLAIVATSCGTTQDELVIEDDTDRNAALATDDGKSFVGMSCCVRDIAKDSKGKVWVGGDFSVIGRVTGGLASIGLTRFTESRLDRMAGVVKEVIDDGNGGIYAAGYISKVGLSNVKNLVHINNDGSLDRTFNAAVPPTPIVDAALVTSGGQNFLAVLLGDSVVKLDTRTGALVSSFRPTIRRNVASIVDADIAVTSRGLVISGHFFANGSDFVGAIFTDFAGQELAVISASVIDLQNLNPQVWGSVSTVEVSLGTGATPSDIVYLGGAFNAARLMPASGAIQDSDVRNVVRVRWNADGLRIENWARFNGEVRAIEAYRTILGIETAYVGGSFTSVSYADMAINSRFVKVTYDPLRARADVNNAEIRVSGTIDVIRHMTTEGGTALFVSGAISGQEVGGVPLPSGNFAVAIQTNGVWRGAQMAESKADGSIFDVEMINGRIILGGNFSVVGVPSGGLMRLTADGEIEANVLKLISQPNGPVSAVETRSGYVYVGGDFDSVGTGDDRVALNGLARYSLDGQLDPTFRPAFTPTAGDQLRINDIAFAGQKMYVGGIFAFGANRTNFVTFDSSTFSTLQRPWEQFDGEVTSIEPFSDGKFVAVGGAFDSVGDFSTPGVVVIDEVRGRIYESFRTGSAANVEVNDVTYDAASESLYIAYGVGESPIVNRRLDGTIVKRFMNTGGEVDRVSAGDGLVYLGLSSRPMLTVDTRTNLYGQQPDSFSLGSTAVLADKDGAWIAGRGFKIGDNPAYGPVYVSRDGKLVVSPSTRPAIPGLANVADGSAVTIEQSAGSGDANATTTVPVETSQSGGESSPEIAALAEDPLVTVADIGLMASSGRIADEVGNIYGFKVGGDGTISLDNGDIERSTSRSFMVTKAKPGNKSVTVTFVAPRGMKNIKVKAYPSSKALVCSPGKKTSCTIKGLSPWNSYRFSVEGAYGKKKMTSPKSFAVKPIISVRKGSTSSLSAIVGKASGTSPKYATSGACSLVSKNTKLKAPKTKAVCLVSVTTTKGGFDTLRTVTVKVG